MSNVSPNTDGTCWKDYYQCAACGKLMKPNGTYPPLCSKECDDALQNDMEEYEALIDPTFVKLD